jgi:hypothetical protein
MDMVYFHSNLLARESSPAMLTNLIGWKFVGVAELRNWGMTSNRGPGNSGDRNFRIYLFRYTKAIGSELVNSAQCVKR